MRVLRASFLLVTAFGFLVSSGCRRPAPHFSEPNARTHVNMLAGTIGSRPVGSENNARARAYLVDQLELFGYAVRVQTTDAVDEDYGLTVRVSNIIAEKAGARRDAIALISHYDSSPAAPGAADAGLGTAVCLEAGRLLASKSRQHSIVIILTDGEESGLMGARAVVKERDVMDRVRAYLNFEAVGSSGAPILFETGPGNQWLVEAWAKHAPQPRGSSQGYEIYKRLPNDTDFSVFKRTGIPGLNFAPTGDSYAYHTANDTPDRLSAETLQELGANAVALVEALDGQDLPRGGAQAIFFDVAHANAMAYGPAVEKILSIAAIVLGMIAWIRALAIAARGGGILWLVMRLIGALAATLLASAVMVFAVWALRASREVYHPWNAHPWRMYALLIACGIGGMWFVARTGRVVRAVRRRRAGQASDLAEVKDHRVDAASVWSVALPVWIGLSAFVAVTAPAASYLFAIPLLVAAASIIVPLRWTAWWYVGAVLTLAASGTFWLPDVRTLFDFVIPIFSRLSFVTPVWVYPALVLVAGMMIGPPVRVLFGAVRGVSASRRQVGSRLVSAALLAAIAILAAAAWNAPAYTDVRPLRRHVRFISDGVVGKALWEVGANEPGLDLADGAPGTWERVTAPPQLSVPVRSLRLPFVFRTDAPAVPGPGAATAKLERSGDELTVDITARVEDPAGRIVFVVPGASGPLRSNLPGSFALIRGAWASTFVAPPPEGVSWRAVFAASDEALVRRIGVLVGSAGLPGGTGWQRLPAWLPQERTVWEGFAYWVLPVAFDETAALR